MNVLPVRGLSQEEQAKRMQQLYRLMGVQVKRYHKARYMGENTSVSVELAQELMESVLYTLDQAGGVEENPNLSDGLEKGQRILEEKKSQAEQLLRLVEATAPAWQGENRWDVIQSLAAFLHTYDWKHLAHRQLDNLYYPLPMAVPGHLKGIDYALFFLQMLWIENQIMDAFPEKELDRFWSVFCQQDRGLAENQCECLLIQAMGKILLSGDVETLVFTVREREALQRLFSQEKPEQAEQLLYAAAAHLASACKLQDPNGVSYVRQAASNLLPRLTAALGGNLAAIFIGEQ